MRRRSPRLDQTAGHSCDERLGPNVSRIGESGLTRPSARRPASRLRRRSRIVHATMEARTVSRSRSRTPDRQPGQRHVPPSCPLGHISRRAVGRRDTRSLEGDSRWYALPGVISQPLPRPKLLGVEDDPDALDPAFSDLERVHADGRPLVDRHRSRLTIDRSFHQIHRGWMPSEIDEAAGDLRSALNRLQRGRHVSTAVGDGSRRGIEQADEGIDVLGLPRLLETPRQPCPLGRRHGRSAGLSESAGAPKWRAVDRLEACDPRWQRRRRTGAQRRRGAGRKPAPRVSSTQG
jgi:hypothetical protein